MLLVKRWLGPLTRSCAAPLAAWGCTRLHSSMPASTFSEVVIALGSNQGNRVENLLEGLTLLPKYGVEPLRVSLLYETAPELVTEQPAFLNAALLGRTDLPPLNLLYNVKQIEKAAGRDLQGGLRFGPRPLDLDIIFYGSEPTDHESLTVPHPRWHERKFVKAPVADLLQPEDLQRGHIHEPQGQGSVLGPLREAVRMWEQAGGEAQVGAPGLARVLPIHRQIWELNHSTHIMGVLNITPDSFSDGGQHAAEDVAAALEAARQMYRAGAQSIDVGGQSTRPGAEMVSAEEEMARVLPVIEALREDSEMVHVPVSIDTFYSSVAEAAVAAGADMVNDVSGGTLDDKMLATVARLGVPYVLMHMRGTPQTMSSPQYTQYDCVWREVGLELQQKALGAIKAGILPWNLVLDPGLGFSKTAGDSAKLLGRLRDMTREGLPGILAHMPLLVGPSRKGFIGRLTGRKDPKERDLGTAAACVVAVAQGAEMVRVHNVEMTAEALRVADGVFRPVWHQVAD